MKMLNLKLLSNLKVLILISAIILGFSSFIFAGGLSIGGSGASGTAQQATNQISTTMCAFYTTIMQVIMILAILLMVMGGALYAGSHIMPGQLKGQMQGYAYGMLLGGVVGLIIVLAGPAILHMIVSGNAQLSNQSCA